jgi:hypothetical protein
MVRVLAPSSPALLPRGDKGASELFRSWRVGEVHGTSRRKRLPCRDLWCLGGVDEGVERTVLFGGRPGARFLDLKVLAGPPMIWQAIDAGWDAGRSLRLRCSVLLLPACPLL